MGKTNNCNIQKDEAPAETFLFSFLKNSADSSSFSPYSNSPY